MHKRILAFLLSLALLLCLTACGQSPAQTPAQTTETQTTAAREAEGDIAPPQEQPQTTQPQETTQPIITPSEAAAMDTNTGPMFQKFVREKVADGTYTLHTEQAGMKITVSADGADSAIESDAAGILRFSLVHKDGAYYMIMHTTKKYTQMSEQEYKKQVSDVGSAAVDLDGMQFRQSGTESLDGRSYATETYDERDQGVVTYFFDDTGVRRTRVVKDGKTSVTDVFSVSADADASMFEIPAGYTLVSDPAQLLS